MFKVAPDTRMGLSYRSSIKYHVTGTVVFSGVPVATLTAITLRSQLLFQTEM